MKIGFTMKTCLVIGFVLGMSGISNGANAKDDALPLDFDPSSVCLGYDRDDGDTFTYQVVCGDGRMFSAQRTDTGDYFRRHVDEARKEAKKLLADSGFVEIRHPNMAWYTIFEKKPSIHDYCLVGLGRSVLCTDDNLSARVVARREAARREAARHDGTCRNDEQVLGDEGLKLVIDFAVVNMGTDRLFVK